VLVVTRLAVDQECQDRNLEPGPNTTKDQFSNKYTLSFWLKKQVDPVKYNARVPLSATNGAKGNWRSDVGSSPIASTKIQRHYKHRSILYGCRDRSAKV